MRMVAWLFSAVAWIGTLGIASTAWADALEDIVPKLITGPIVTISTTAETVRPVAPDARSDTENLRYLGASSGHGACDSRRYNQGDSNVTR